MWYQDIVTEARTKSETVYKKISTCNHVTTVRDKSNLSTEKFLICSIPYQNVRHFVRDTYKLLTQILLQNLKPETPKSNININVEPLKLSTSQKVSRPNLYKQTVYLQ